MTTQRKAWYISMCTFLSGYKYPDGSLHFHDDADVEAAWEAADKTEPINWASMVGHAGYRFACGQPPEGAVEVEGLRYALDVDLRKFRNLMRAEGYKSIAVRDAASVEKGRKLYAEGNELYAEGQKLCDEGQKLCDEGQKLFAEGAQLFAERQKLFAQGRKLFATGDKRYAESQKLFAEGDKLLAQGQKLYAEGQKLCAEGDNLFAEGDKLCFDIVKDGAT